MTIRAVPTPGGGHDIVTDQYPIDGRPLVLVKVRPVGTLEWGDLPMFVPEWVPDLIEALQLAKKIADREKPWEPWTDPPAWRCVCAVQGGSPYSPLCPIHDTTVDTADPHWRKWYDDHLEAQQRIKERLGWT